MMVRRVKVELEDGEKTISCHYYNYPNDIEPTIVIIDGKEYLGELDIEKDDGYYVIRFKKIK